MLLVLAGFWINLGEHKWVYVCTLNIQSVMKIIILNQNHNYVFAVDHIFFNCFELKDYRHFNIQIEYSYFRYVYQITDETKSTITLLRDTNLC